MQVVVDSRKRKEFLKLRDQIANSATITAERLKKLLQESTPPLKLFFQMKFSLVGRHPLQDRSLNLIEQVNQIWTFLTSFRAVEVLWDEHPDIYRFRLNLGTKGGYDVEDMTDLTNEPAGLRVVGEVYAATTRNGNRKLSKERKKLLASVAAMKYLFFFVPGEEPGRRQRLEAGRADLRVWSLNQVAGDLGTIPGAGV